MSDVVFPQLSKETSAEGVVATWFADNGDQVTEGQLIAEVAVDKVDAEVHAPTAGTLSQVVAEGGITTEGSVIARIE